MAKVAGPDKGWSWVVAFACCFSSLVLAGIFRTSGVLFVAFIGTFGVSREAASWPMVVCISVLNLTGPFSGILGQKIGARPVVIIGAIIATIGISSCYLTTSLSVITLLFGGVFGVGYGFMNTVMPCILNAHFLNLRATANGIANSGSCVGSIILPVVFEYFISTYGLSGCFLLTGGIVLHIAIAGCLMRSPSWLKRNPFQGVEEGMRNDAIKCAVLKNVESQVETSDNHSVTNDLTAASESSPCLLLSYKESNSQLNEKDASPESALLGQNRKSSSQPCLVETTEETLKPCSDSTFEELEATSKKNRLTCLPCNWCPSVCDCEKTSRGIIASFVAVLTCPMFYVTAITNVTFYFLYHMYVVIIVDYSLDRGVLDTNAKYILFAFSIADLFGRLSLGWVTDRKLISRSRFVMTCMALIGLTFFMFPLATGYWSLIAVSCCYGLLLGCTMVVFTILLVDFCGLELHTISFGCMCFMNGFASFGRPFLIGYFRDYVGSYAKMFYVLGTLSLVASTLWLLEKPFERRRQGEPFFGSCKKCTFAK
ncbi:monocarboxylate transporter 13 [Trichonephila clavata]|uniref:Monocarboxylate transporter 13 n=1 Tax=Trichonephila clavata TaxID=2740835 RepID=A0A8X6M360_TRICU|nr:monocarboxylate transporter 13 [Trichonephila clavata]